MIGWIWLPSEVLDCCCKLYSRILSNSRAPRVGAGSAKSPPYQMDNTTKRQSFPVSTEHIYSCTAKVQILEVGQMQKLLLCLCVSIISHGDSIRVLRRVWRRGEVLCRSYSTMHFPTSRPIMKFRDPLSMNPEEREQVPSRQSVGCILGLVYSCAELQMSAKLLLSWTHIKSKLMPHREPFGHDLKQLCSRWKAIRQPPCEIQRHHIICDACLG